MKLNLILNRISEEFLQAEDEQERWIVFGNGVVRKIWKVVERWVVFGNGAASKNVIAEED